MFPIGYSASTMRSLTAARALSVPLRDQGVALLSRLPHLTQGVNEGTCGPSATLAAIRYFHPSVRGDERGTAQAAWLASTLPTKWTMGPSMVWNDLEALATVVRAYGLYAKVESGSFHPSTTSARIADAIVHNQVLVVHQKTKVFKARNRGMGRERQSS